MFKSFFNDMLKTVKSYEDVLSTKGVLRTTAKGMHSTANALRASADYIDQKATLLEDKANEIEMKEFMQKVATSMGEVVPQDVVRIPASKLGEMSHDDICNTLGISINGVNNTNY